MVEKNERKESPLTSPVTRDVQLTTVDFVGECSVLGGVKGCAIEKFFLRKLLVFPGGISGDVH